MYYIYIYIKTLRCDLGSTIWWMERHIHESTRCWTSQVTNGGLHQFALHLKLVTWTWTTILVFLFGGGKEMWDEIIVAEQVDSW